MKRALGTLAIVALTLLAYWPSLRGPFLWDDGLNVTRNRLVTQPGGLSRIWFSTEPADYYPVTFTVFRAEWLCWGNRPTGYRVVNLLLHIANALLLWRIFRALELRGAWLAALLFALHPVNVATVAWITELKNLLAFAFAGLTALAWVRFDETRRTIWFVAALGAFLLALLSKAAVAPLPFVLLGVTWWRHKRFAWRETAPFFALALALGLVAIWFQHHRVLEGSTVRQESFLTRIADAGLAVWFYLWKASVPVNLSLVYPHVRTGFIPVVVLMLVLVLCWRHGRGAFFALAGFVAMMFPMLGFFDQGFYAYALVSDHWQYLALPLLVAVVAARWPIGVAAAVALGLLTFARATLYADDAALWRDTLRKNPQAWVAHFNLGLALRDRGDLASAEREYREALRLNPKYAEAHNNLGNLLSKSGRLEEATLHFAVVLRLNPNVSAAHNNLGVALARLGKYEAAAECFREALRLDAGYTEARDNLALALARQKRDPNKP
jgi:tetratricopeptide (TPR) repeat protein